MADDGATVPKFGEWNDRDAAPPDNYSAIFQQVRQERQETVARAPTLPSTSSNINRSQHPNHKRCCCFPWRWRRN